MGLQNPASAVTVYRTREAFPDTWQYKYGQGRWTPGTPFPGGYSLVPPDFPTMKPTALKGLPGVSANFVREISKPRNLLIIAGAIGIIVFKKQVFGSLKKVGRKVGIK